MKETIAFDDAVDLLDADHKAVKKLFTGYNARCEDGSPAAARWTIVSNGPYSYVSPDGIFNGNVETPLATLYGVDPAKKTKGEFGAFITASLRKDIFKNVTYISKLDLYSNYLDKPKNVDVFESKN